MFHATLLTLQFGSGEAVERLRIKRNAACMILLLYNKLEANCGQIFAWFPSVNTPQERDVMLDLPPGGATILCAVRLGMWSSI